MRPPFALIPTHLEPIYLKLRVALAVGIVILGAAIAYAFLFPTIETSFDFRNPKSSKNQIFDPRSEIGTPRTNGKLETTGQLVANTSPLGDFSELTVELDLEKQSETPNQINVSVEKSYRAFRYPVGDPITDFPAANLYQIDGNYYVLQDQTLHPFVSDAAFLSRYPATMAREESISWRDRYVVAPDFVGFRIGSLISFADGVYIVTSDTDIRPIGSAEIFLALGLNFEDVIPVSEEDLGIYKRGRIFLMGAAHPDGTLFEDASSGTLYLVDGGTRRPVESARYRDFLKSQIHPILASESGSDNVAHCTAVAGFLPRTLSCTLTLDPVKSSLGPDYEIVLAAADTDIDISTLTLAFTTRLDRENMTTLLAKIKMRVLTRFGLATP